MQELKSASDKKKNDTFLKHSCGVSSPLMMFFSQQLHPNFVFQVFIYGLKKSLSSSGTPNLHLKRLVNPDGSKAVVFIGCVCGPLGGGWEGSS